MAQNPSYNRLSGINPLSYMGVEPYTPPQLVVDTRAPIQNDINFRLGTLWLRKDPEAVWMLASVEQGLATWVPLYPQGGGGGAENFVTDLGTAVSNAGTINVLGGSNINTAGAADIVTVNLNDNVTLLGNLVVNGTSNLISSVTVGANLTVNGPIVRLSLAGTPAGVLVTGPTGIVTSSSGLDGEVLIGNATGLGAPAPIWNPITSTDGSITITNGPGTIDLSAAIAAGNVIVTTYSVPGAFVWTKNAQTKYISVYAWGGGGGGGSGRSGASGAAGGGAGGNGTAGFHIEGPATFFSSPLNVVVGVGGTGGNGVINSDGNPGVDGTPSAFGTLITKIGNSGTGGKKGTNADTNPIIPNNTPFNFTNYGSFVQAVGTGSINAQISPVTGNSPFYNWGRLIAGGDGFYTGSPGGLGYVTNPPVGAGTSTYANVQNNLLMNSADGGGGGGAHAVTPFDGGLGGACVFQGVGGTLAAGGTKGSEATSIDGGAGANQATANGVVGSAAGGGGGAGQCNDIRGGDGGNGGFPGGGGGGGGGALTGNLSGTGGKGGDGLVIVIEYR